MCAEIKALYDWVYTGISLEMGLEELAGSGGPLCYGSLTPLQQLNPAEFSTD